MFVTISLTAKKFAGNYGKKRPRKTISFVVKQKIGKWKFLCAITYSSSTSKLLNFSIFSILFILFSSTLKFIVFSSKFYLATISEHNLNTLAWSHIYRQSNTEKNILVKGSKLQYTGLEAKPTILKIGTIYNHTLLNIWGPVYQFLLEFSVVSPP